MKKISFLLAFFASFFFFQVMGQNNPKKDIKEISQKINDGQKTEAIKLLSKLQTPELTDKEACFFVCYSYLKFYFPKDSGMTEEYIECILDTISNGKLLFQTMPETGILFFTPKTKAKIVRLSKNLIDVDGESFQKLQKFYKDTLLHIQEYSEQDNIIKEKKDPIKITEIQNYDSLQVARDTQFKKLKDEISNYRQMLGDTIEKYTTQGALTDLKKNAPEALNDSVYLNIEVYSIDSMKLEAYLVQPTEGQISVEHSVAQYCNEKVNAYVKNGVYEILQRWCHLTEGDTLEIYVEIIGEADDVWSDTTQLQTFSEDCYGIGSQLKLKAGDKITNYQIANLRTLNAQKFLGEGIKKTEAETKKVIKMIKPPDLSSVDWRKNDKEEKGPQFRKETIMLVRQP
ncbi:hypothetical protein KKA39_01610 [Patescibacteria group bacterium]|nr:hypothetical protein [Patescibacteria group bacterium]MBU1727989.1 hypothetical protein [Patescibacteria group bacterium]